MHRNPCHHTADDRTETVFSIDRTEAVTTAMRCRWCAECSERAPMPAMTIARHIGKGSPTAIAAVFHAIGKADPFDGLA